MADSLENLKSHRNTPQATQIIQFFRFLFQAYRRNLDDRFDRVMYLRDRRLTDNPYNMNVSIVDCAVFFGFVVVTRTIIQCSSYDSC